MTTLDPRWKWMRQLAAFAVLLLLWEAAGRAGLLNPLFVPSPSLIGSALYELFADGRIWPHLDATFTAALLGLALGILAGIVLGVVAALLRPVAELLEPVMTLLNAIPRVVLAPLFVIWLGIDLASKVALAFILVAVVIFFTVYQRHPAGRPQAGRAHRHARRRPLGSGAACVPAVGGGLGARQPQDRGRLCLHRRLRRRVRGREPQASAISCRLRSRPTTPR